MPKQRAVLQLAFTKGVRREVRCPGPLQGPAAAFTGCTAVYTEWMPEAKHLSSDDGRLLHIISELTCCNPFLPRRIELEREALGPDFDESAAVWNKAADWQRQRPNLQALRERAEGLACSLREQAIEDSLPSDRVPLYEDLILYLLYDRYRGQFSAAANTSDAQSHSAALPFWKSFCKDFDHFLKIPQLAPVEQDPAHLFACCFQVCRAFSHIFNHIFGASMPAARLRAAVWQSIFTHDMQRYRRVLYQRMGDFTTLITGPSGTGKELVARAIALSRYVPFDGRKGAFTHDFSASFHALNLSALSPTLIESELFGHCRGAFTGAVSDRQGWLEVCGPLGTVFLDEIGELDGALQVKLLRVLQTRVFQRLGETDDRQFAGKIIAATNQDLESQSREGTFREDFYFRLCSDTVATPSLHAQLGDSPADLRNLIGTCVVRVMGGADEELTLEIERWISQQLGSDYTWPGNFRELEQCVRNLIVRQEYRTSTRVAAAAVDARQQLSTQMLAGAMTADELLCAYCTLVYAQTGSYESAARRIGLDRRTVKRKIDPQLLRLISRA